MKSNSKNLYIWKVVQMAANNQWNSNRYKPVIYTVFSVKEIYVVN